MNINLKKMLPAVCACTLVGSIAIGSTSAYLIDNSARKNTFVMGNVMIDQIEPAFDKNNAPLQPHQSIPKNPMVENIGTNDAIVFMVVESPVADVTPVDMETGQKGTKGPMDLFWYKETGNPSVVPTANDWDDSWVALEDRFEVSNTAGTPSKYMFAYTKVLASGEKTTSLFDEVQLKSFLEGEVAAKQAQLIKVKSYAIQSTEIMSGNYDLTDDLTDIDNLYEIYDIFMNQESFK